MCVMCVRDMYVLGNGPGGEACENDMCSVAHPVLKNKTVRPN